jgi:mediator of RNA polymerase II transcription subunit 17
MLTLDFVSLLLSKETPVQAGLTLSPELREMVGIGTLGATNLTSSDLVQTRMQEDKLLGTGRKLLDIRQTADSLLSAASRLQEEIGRETKYWTDVLAVSNSGWSVSKLPTEQHTMGVKFGFSECKFCCQVERVERHMLIREAAAPEFRATSVAAMRRTDDGSVVLDTGKLGGGTKRLLVSIERMGKIVGQSSLPQPLSEDSALGIRVLEARNSVLAQELWHEINREGRTLLSYNVRLEESSVTFDLSDEIRYIFELVTIGDDEDTGGCQAASHEEDGNADTICKTLYILLSFGHRQNGRQRSQQPLLSGVQARMPSQPHFLLRPILAYLLHERNVQRTITSLSELVGKLHAAGHSEATYTVNEQPIAIQPGAPASEALIAVMLSPMIYRAELVLTRDARLEFVGNTFISQYITGYFRIILLPPKKEAGAQDDIPPSSDDPTLPPPPPPPPDVGANPLFHLCPPWESYPNLAEVMIYLRLAVDRILTAESTTTAEE